MKTIETEHELEQDEYWPLGAGPKEYNELASEYSNILDKKLRQLIDRIAHPEVANFARKNPNEANDLQERGRRSIHHKDEVLLAVEDNIYRFESEAIKSKENRCWYSALFSIASCLEGALLAKCLENKKTAKRVAKTISQKNKTKQHKRALTDWTFNYLIEICSEAGWLKAIMSDRFEYKTNELAKLLKDTRNFIHPGRHAISRPWTDVGEKECEESFAVYTVLLMALGKS